MTGSPNKSGRSASGNPHEWESKARGDADRNKACIFRDFLRWLCQAAGKNWDYTSSFQPGDDDVFFSSSANWVSFSSVFFSSPAANNWTCDPLSAKLTRRTDVPEPGEHSTPRLQPRRQLEQARLERPTPSTCPSLERPIVPDCCQSRSRLPLAGPRTRSPRFVAPFRPKIQLRLLCCAAAVTSIFAGLFALVSGPSQAHAFTRSQRSTVDIDAWIQQLDATSFRARTKASEQLLQAGAPAIPSLEQAATGGSLERTTRCVEVLRRLALAEDTNVATLAASALERLAEARITTSARLATEALSSLSRARRQQAAAVLRKLGAKIQITDVDSFSGLSQVDVEIPNDWRGTPADLRRLEWLDGIVRLRLENPLVDNQWIEQLPALETLSDLLIKRGRLTAPAIAEIDKRFPSLAGLDLMYCAVEDDSVPPLLNFDRLRRLRLYGTQITPAGSNQLLEKFGADIVDYRRGAFLGVYCQQVPCIVTRLSEGGGAEKAGIRTNDVIVRFDDHPIFSFEDLKERIAVRTVGDRVKVIVARELRSETASLQIPENALEGFEGRDHPLGVVVEKFGENSFFAKAGFTPNTLLISIDGVTPPTREILTKKLGNTQAGQIVQLIYSKQMEEQEIQVTFGEWSE